MERIESISYSVELGQRAYSIEVFNDETQQSLILSLPAGRYDKSTIVSALIRCKYTQDQVEAIINNHFLAIGDWIDAKLSGSSDKFEDPAYDQFQLWRSTCKRLANEIIEIIDK